MCGKNGCFWFACFVLAEVHFDRMHIEEVLIFQNKYKCMVPTFNNVPDVMYRTHKSCTCIYILFQIGKYAEQRLVSHDQNLEMT